MKKTAFALAVSVLLLSCTNVLKEKIAEGKNKHQHQGDLLEVAKARIVPGVSHHEVFALHEAIREGLASDRLSGVPSLAKQLAERASKDAEGAAESKAKVLGEVQKTALVLTKKHSEDELRTRYGDLSQKIIALHKEVSPKGFKAFRCPMAKRYSDWIQPASLEIENPYMGQRMLACGFPIEVSEAK